MSFPATWLAKILPPWEPKCGKLAGLPSGTGSAGIQRRLRPPPFRPGAPLSLPGDYKGLLAFVLGPPAPGSLHNKVLLRQIPSPLPSAARGQGIPSSLGVGHGTLTLYLGPGL